MLPTFSFAVVLFGLPGCVCVCTHQMPDSLIYVCLCHALKLLIVLMMLVIHVIKCGELGPNQNQMEWRGVFDSQL